jgi:predicted metal-dependent phosphoesterase TrpH
MAKLSCDFHVHTNASYDTTVPPDALARAFWRAGVTCVAITDHNAFEGAAAFARYFPGLTIPGIEVETADGELVGLFLKEALPQGLSAVDTVAAIKEQGGAVYVPHPFVRVLLGRLREEALMTILPDVDAIEAVNARNPFVADDRRAWRFARQHNLAALAGSDAHMARDAGAVKVELPAFEDAEGFKLAIRQARILGWRRIAQHENAYNFLVAVQHRGLDERLRVMLGTAVALVASSLSRDGESPSA